MRPFVHLIADYGLGDPAFAEVIHRLTAAAPEIRVHPTAVPPFSTVATGFWIEQLGRHNPPFDDLLVYSNTAPRTEAARPANRPLGGELCYLELDTGVPVVAVDAGYNLSFVKDAVSTVRTVEVSDTGTQFRSRDLYPRRVAAIAAGDRSAIGPPRSLGNVPDPPTAVVCHVDGYGNIKTSIRASAIDRSAATVTVGIDGVTERATVAAGIFAVDEGELVLAPGSAGGSDPYLEISRRGGSAAAAFGTPAVGDPVAID